MTATPSEPREQAAERFFLESYSSARGHYDVLLPYFLSLIAGFGHLAYGGTRMAMVKAMAITTPYILTATLYAIAANSVFIRHARRDEALEPIRAGEYNAP